ncbi:MAG TPA: NAD-dependent epimerase/dehydratase family protein [Kiritimatiellia bacterium]|nr:NAD-dependent epimerase/dehydratase family protein [Kiritimatiellia bacterium]
MWKDTKVLVTGGASFIGSHLVEFLVRQGAAVRVADNLSSGKRSNLSAVIDDIELLEGNLKELSFAAKASAGCQIVFHLAADHGGRGYIASHPANCVTNMALDNIVFEAAHQNGVERITFASSACVYPADIQEKKVLLKEDMVSFDKPGGAFSDEAYGWAKLMGELSLKAYQKQHGLKTSSVRIFTAYGPRENESHAVIALIAKALIRQTPFEIWGNGEQTRNFTYVDDIVRALVLACEHITDGRAVNAGIQEFISLNRVASAIFDLMNWKPEAISHLGGEPVGVLHRAADASYARAVTGWMPAFSFEQGLKATVDWYVQNHDPDIIKRRLSQMLKAR